MFIGYLKVKLFIPNSHSLKEKRQLISGIKQRIRNSYNISVGEKPLDKWQITELSFVCVNYTKRCVEKTMFKVEEFIHFYKDVQVLDTEREIL
ncbi:MAG: hypothetical protein B6D55_06535 [Candidatus Omnitrophica bacterium 4484_70.2]|nr:MAG: hypothetical protein B6D55_06535 [Candidatus Omnitrophica bacterium 4484_70.2]